MVREMENKNSQIEIQVLPLKLALLCKRDNLLPGLEESEVVFIVSCSCPALIYTHIALGRFITSAVGFLLVLEAQPGASSTSAWRREGVGACEGTRPLPGSLLGAFGEHLSGGVTAGEILIFPGNRMSWGWGRCSLEGLMRYPSLKHPVSTSFLSSQLK